MRLSDEEINEWSEESDDSFDEKETGSNLKRKNKENVIGPLKKVKYENIGDETKPKRKSKNDLYRPPTVEELKEIKETESLYNNNLFRLQIEELVKEISVKNENQEVFNSWLDEFKKDLNKLPEFDEVLLSNIKVDNKKKLTPKQKFLNKLSKSNTISIKCDQDLSLKFIHPKEIEVFGLHHLNSKPGPGIKVKINVKIPTESFHKKDYLNNRYFVRRYYYLLYISQILSSNSMKIRWKYYLENELMPILEVSLQDSDVLIEIFASPAKLIFKSSRFSPEVNNIKTTVFDYISIDGDENIKNVATPFYNSLLAYDLTLSSNNEYETTILQSLDNVKEGIKLLHVWMTQRQLNVGHGCFSEDLLKYFIIYLIFKKKLINKHMSSYQVVRNFWNFIKETDLRKESIYICDNIPNENLDHFKKNFDIVCLDRTGFYNVAAFFNINFYLKLKYESDIAFKLIDDGGIHAFHSLFISKLHLELQYDVILTVNSKKCFANILESVKCEEIMKFASHKTALITREICNTLKQGLNKRISLIVPHIEMVRQAGNILSEIRFGINLDPVNAFSFLELGPSLTDPEEKEFRKFWGHLSSDRRFKDGTVCVAVYFETKTIKGKRDIIKQIIDWVVKKKLKLDYSLCYDEFEDLLLNKKVNGPFPMGTNEECCLKAISASDDLGKKLRSLELPLSITGIQGISDVFCFTDVFPPIGTNSRCIKKVTTTAGDNIIFEGTKLKIVPRYVMPMESVLQLEHSSKWFRNLEGVRHMKTAFYLHIAKLLKKKHNILSCVKSEFLDIFYEGLIFRFILHIPREISLLKKETTQDGMTVYKDSPESIEMEKKLEILPKIVGAFKGIQSQFPTFGPSTALIKRWLRSQLIDNNLFPDIVINLLNASLYVNQSPFLDPCTPQLGFLRFLQFFSELQYDIQPVIVNFNETISKQSLADIDSKLLQNRSSCPHLYIITPYDNHLSLFTKISPTKEVLRRVKQLTSETLNFVHNSFLKRQILKPKQLFIPNLNGYNVLIHLKPILNPLRHQQVISDELEGIMNLDAYDSKIEQKIPIIDFNPVQLYLKELRNNYSEFADFFHDSYGGNVVGVLWKPKALEAKEFKISNVNGRKLEDDKLILNIDGLIEDFYVLGKDLVKTIERR